MSLVYLLAAALVSLYVATYGLWLNKNGNKSGAVFAVCLALACIGFPSYRIVLDP